MPRGTEGRTKVNGRPHRLEEAGPFEVDMVIGQAWMETADVFNERWRDGWELSRVFALGGGTRYCRLWRRRREPETDKIGE